MLSCCRGDREHGIAPTNTNPGDREHGIAPTNTNPGDREHGIAPTSTNPGDRGRRGERPFAPTLADC
ncbi:MAG: hypothetical protein F6J93_12635 [Oscillatoria sp. SIO1A7]|nr:hypothetical protein [Oscillatoria sp. SIO1A7]